MSKFKVGDRVRTKREGFLGTVIDVHMSPGNVVAEMDGPNVGVEVSQFPGRKVYWLGEDSYEKVAGNAKIVITTDGITTIARLYDGKKVMKSAEAKCAPGDTFNFNTCAQLAFNRLVYGTDYHPAEVALKKDKPAEPAVFKAGGKAKCVKTEVNYFTVGKVYDIDADGCITSNDGFRFTTGRFKTSAEWLAASNGAWFEPYTEPEQEPIKLYCTEDWAGGSIKKGKVYEFDGHRVNYDGLECVRAGDFEDWKRRDPGFSERLVPLVSRPAKVGEWVYITEGKAKGVIGEVLDIDHAGVPLVRHRDVWGMFADQNGMELTRFSISQYLVLDGYHPKPECCRCCGQPLKKESTR